MQVPLYIRHIIEEKVTVYEAWINLNTTMYLKKEKQEKENIWSRDLLWTNHF